MTVPPTGARVSLLWAGPERARSIATLHGQLFDPGWSEDAVRALLEHPASTAFVALAGQPDIAGFVMSQIAADEAEILSLGVAPTLQRRGVGQELVQGLCRSMRRHEIGRLFLEVAADNEAALAMYGKLGFAEIGRRSGYYQRAGRPNCDAINLALTL